MKRVKLLFFIVVVFIILIITGCNKAEDISKEKCEVIEVKTLSDMKPKKAIISEEKIYTDQFGGISNKKKKFYIIDYLSQKENKKIILQIRDLKTSQLKKTVPLNLGTYMAPNEFSGYIGRINYLKNKYYILNYKISIFDEDFKYQDCSVIREQMDLGGLNYFKIGNKTNLFVSFITHEEKGVVTTALINNFAIYELIAGSPIYGAKIIVEKIKNWTKYKSVFKESNQVFFHLNYFMPKGFALTIKDKLYYSVNTKQGFFVYDINTKKKRFIKLSWLKGKIYTDEEALAVGTFKTQNLNDKKSFKARKFKAYYKSGKTNKLYFLWMLKGSGNTLILITDLNTKENTFVANIIDISSGKLISRIILPYGQHFTRLLRNTKSFSIPQFYIDYKRCIYIYGDRDDDWNELVRYCWFKVK